MPELPGLVTGFLNSYGQMAAMRQKQIQDTVDQEMAQQRFDQQNAAQQSLDTYRNNETTWRNRQSDIAQQRADTADQTAQDRASAAQDREDRLTKQNQTSNFWREFYNSANQGRGDVRSAANTASQVSGFPMTPELMSSIMQMGGYTQHDIPSQPGPAAQPENAGPLAPNTVGQVGDQAITTLGTPSQPPPMGSLLLPGSQAYMDRQKALDEASKARANLQRVQADRIQQLAPLDAEYEQAKIDLANLQKDWGAQRIAIAKSNSIARQIYDGEQINLAKTRNQIALINTRLRSAEIYNRVDNQAMVDARQTRQIMSTELGRVQTEARGLSAVIDKNDKIARLAAQTAQGYAEAGDTSSKEYMVASNMAQSMTREVASQKARLRDLNIRADKYRDTLNLIPGQTPITSSGSPVGPPALVPRGGSLSPLKNLGMAFEGPAKVAPPSSPVTKTAYDKQGNKVTFTLKNGQWVKN